MFGYAGKILHVDLTNGTIEIEGDATGAVETLQPIQQDAAELLHISQPRVSALLKGKIDEFRLDALLDFVHRLGLHVSINVAA